MNFRRKTTSFQPVLCCIVCLRQRHLEMALKQHKIRTNVRHQVCQKSVFFTEHSGLKIFTLLTTLLHVLL